MMRRPLFLVFVVLSVTTTTTVVQSFHLLAPHHIVRHRPGVLSIGTASTTEGQRRRRNLVESLHDMRGSSNTINSLKAGAAAAVYKPHYSSGRSRTTVRLYEKAAGNNSEDGSSASASFVLSDPLIKESVKTLWRASWFSWWSQVILTTISAVILFFAKNAIPGNVGGTTPSFFLSGVGILLSSLSIVWTWGNGWRLSRRLTIKFASRYKVAHMLRRAIRVGVTLNLLGLLTNLLAAEQIIGSLALKVLTNGRTSIFTNTGAILPPDGLQPLDVLIVQANTNSLLAQFVSLASLLFLVRNVEQLDPPSSDNEPRKKK